MTFWAIAAGYYVGFHYMIFLGGTDYRWFYVALFIILMLGVNLGYLFGAKERRRLTAEYSLKKFDAMTDESNRDI